MRYGARIVRGTAPYNCKPFYYSYLSIYFEANRAFLLQIDSINGLARSC